MEKEKEEKKEEAEEEGENEKGLVLVNVFTVQLAH